MLRSIITKISVFVVSSLLLPSCGSEQNKLGTGDTNDSVLGISNEDFASLCGKPHTATIKGQVAGHSVDRNIKMNGSVFTNFSTSGLEFKTDSEQGAFKFTFPNPYDESQPFSKQVAAIIDLSGVDPIAVGNCYQSNQLASQLSADFGTQTWLFAAREFQSKPFCNGQPVSGEVQGCIRGKASSSELGNYLQQPATGKAYDSSWTMKAGRALKTQKNGKINYQIQLISNAPAEDICKIHRNFFGTDLLSISIFIHPTIGETPPASGEMMESNLVSFTRYDANGFPRSLSSGNDAKVKYEISADQITGSVVAYDYFNDGQHQLNGSFTVTICK